MYAFGHACFILIFLLSLYGYYFYEEQRLNTIALDVDSKFSELIKRYQAPPSFHRKHGELDAVINEVMALANRHQELQAYYKSHLRSLRQLSVFVFLILIVSISGSFYLTLGLALSISMLIAFLKYINWSTIRENQTKSINNLKKYLYNQHITHYQYDLIVYEIFRREWVNKELMLAFVNNIEALKHINHHNQPLDKNPTHS